MIISEIEKFAHSAANTFLRFSEKEVNNADSDLLHRFRFELLISEISQVFGAIRKRRVHWSFDPNKLHRRPGNARESRVKSPSLPLSLIYIGYTGGIVVSCPSYLAGKRIALSGGYSVSPLRKRLRTGSPYHWHVTLFPIDYSDQHFSNGDARGQAAWLTIKLRYRDREGDNSLREK